eukprot:UN28913
MVTRILDLQITLKQKHPSVCLEYFNILVRFYDFFTTHQKYLRIALASFADQRGLRHPVCVVRCQASYKMNKWLKHLSIETRAALRPYLSELLQTLAEAVKVFAECRSSENRAQNGSLLKQDIVHLCDTIGILVPIVGDEQKAAYLFREANNPLLATVKNIRQSINNKKCTNTEKIQNIARLSDLFSSLAAATKSFNSKKGYMKVWLNEVVTVCTDSYSLLSTEEDLRYQFVFVLHQMVRSLSTDLVPLIPCIWKLLLSTINSENAIRTFQLIKSMITKLGGHPKMKTVVDEYLKHILQAFDLVLKEYNNLGKSKGAAVSHLENERKDIIKHYYFLLSSVARNSDLAACLLSEKNSSFFKKILMSLLVGCEMSSENDYETIRCALTTWRYFINVWQPNIDKLPFFKKYVS